MHINGKDYYLQLKEDAGMMEEIIDIINLEEQYLVDKLQGNAIDIKAENHLINNVEKAFNGIYSPLFGSNDIGDMDSVVEKYTCKCGLLVGKDNKGIICEDCNTEVIARDLQLTKQGWLHSSIPMLHPTLGKIFESFVGGKHFSQMLNTSRDIDVDGNLKMNVTENNYKKNPFYACGLKGIYENFDKIMEFFYKPTKQESYDFIMEHRSKLFTTKIPVIPLILRPILISDTIWNSDINSHYSRCSKCLLKIKYYNDRGEYHLADRQGAIAQRKIFQIFESIIGMLKSKTGVIRGEILGGRVDFSARNVVVIKDKVKRINEISLPYKTFLECYKQQICYHLMQRGMTLNEADYKWNMAKFQFDKTIYNIMKYMVNSTPGGLRCLINRNPTIATPGSIWCVYITEVKESFTDLTMGISTSIIMGMNMDFDGDVGNIYPILQNEWMDIFERYLSPEHHMIDILSGKISGKMMLVKDQAIGLYMVNNF